MAIGKQQYKYPDKESPTSEDRLTGVDASGSTFNYPLRNLVPYFNKYLDFTGPDNGLEYRVVEYGTEAHTVAEGNDERILNGQLAFDWGNHGEAGYATMEELNATAEGLDTTVEGLNVIVEGLGATIEGLEGEMDDRLVADEEDLTFTQDGDLRKGHLKDRSALGDQRGYKIIRSDFDFTSIPVDYADSIWEIRYEHDLLAGVIALPSGVTLKYNGGFLKNGELQGDDAEIDCGLCHFFDSSITFTGTWNIKESYPEWFGASGRGISDDYSAVQQSIDLMGISGGMVSLVGTKYKLLSTIIIPSGVSFIGNGYTVVELNNASIATSISGVNGIFASDQASVYYKHEPSDTSGNVVASITSTALKGTSVVGLSSVAGLTIGDKLFLSNGYCDMWRVMEQYTGQQADWNREEVDLWRSEIVEIKSILGNDVTLTSPLSFDVILVPTTYGYFADENSKDDYVGFNTPSIELLNGAIKSSIKNLVIDNKSGLKSIVSIFSQDLIIDNIFFKGLGRGASIISSLDTKISNIKSETIGFSINVRGGSQGATITNVNATYSEGDATVLIMENSQCCTVSNMVFQGVGTSLSLGGLYFNTCRNCSAVNITGRGLKTVVSVGFCSGGIVMSNITAINSDRVFSVFSSYGVVADGASSIGSLTHIDSIYTSMLFAVSDSNNVTVSNVMDTEPYSVTARGRIHIYQSYKVTILKVNAPSLYLWDSTSDDVNYSTNSLRLECRLGEYHTGIFDDTYDKMVAGNARLISLSDVMFISKVNLSYLRFTKLIRCKTLGLSGTGLNIIGAPFTFIKDSEIYGTSIGIEFQLSGTLQTTSSLVRIEGSVIDAPIQFSNYINIVASVVSTGASSSIGQARKGEIFSDLSQYPLLKDVCNVGDVGSTTDWEILRQSPGYI